MDVSSLTHGTGAGSSLANKSPSFAEFSGSTFNSFMEGISNVETVSKDVLSGQADTQSLVETVTQAQLAMEAAVMMRDKAVEAYQEIIRMPV